MTTRNLCTFRLGENQVMTPEKVEYLKTHYGVTPSSVILMEINKLPGKPVANLERLHQFAGRLKLKRQKRDAMPALKWTVERNEMLIKMCAEHAPLEDIRIAVNQLPAFQPIESTSAIMRQARKLGLKGFRVHKKVAAKDTSKVIWTPERIKRLTELWKRLIPKRMIAERINELPGPKISGPEAIRHKARKLKLPSRHIQAQQIQAMGAPFLPKPERAPPPVKILSPDDVDAKLLAKLEKIKVRLKKGDDEMEIANNMNIPLREVYRLKAEVRRKPLQ